MFKENPALRTKMVFNQQETIFLPFKCQLSQITSCQTAFRVNHKKYREKG